MSMTRIGGPSLPFCFSLCLTLLSPISRPTLLLSSVSPSLAPNSVLHSLMPFTSMFFINLIHTFASMPPRSNINFALHPLLFTAISCWSIGRCVEFRLKSSHHQLPVCLSALCLAECELPHASLICGCNLCGGAQWRTMEPYFLSFPSLLGRRLVGSHAGSYWWICGAASGAGVASC
ncbi:hypothetical protein C1H46_033458 [Malus baccata]|uniref:Uncharacterized protein n=1 Tax=Malus baccata TaxID=106549 RepID=A0A540L3D7_MALBA|nr:hypothetical protein C1H46_033458 [Malus baccata]